MFGRSENKNNKSFQMIIMFKSFQMLFNQLTHSFYLFCSYQNSLVNLFSGPFQVWNPYKQKKTFSKYWKTKNGNN